MHSVEADARNIHSGLRKLVAEKMSEGIVSDVSRERRADTEFRHPGGNVRACAAGALRKSGRGGKGDSVFGRDEVDKAFAKARYVGGAFHDPGVMILLMVFPSR